MRAAANPSLAYDLKQSASGIVSPRGGSGLPEPAPGFAILPKEAIVSLHKLYDSVDIDGSGDLNQSEVTKLLKKLGMFTDEDEAHRVYEEMDRDRSGDVDFGEFATQIDKTLYEAYADQTKNEEELIKIMNDFEEIKTGFAGTTWRKQANVIWMMNGGVMIITASVMLVFTVQGAFLPPIFPRRSPSAFCGVIRHRGHSGLRGPNLQMSADLIIRGGRIVSLAPGSAQRALAGAAHAPQGAICTFSSCSSAPDRSARF